MLCTHHIISNFVPSRTKMGKIIRLSFMCFLAAIEKMNSSCQECDSHSMKSQLFPISLRKGLYFKTVLHCSGLRENKTRPSGKMLSFLALPDFLMVCVYQGKETCARKPQAGTDHRADQRQCKCGAAWLPHSGAMQGQRLPHAPAENRVPCAPAGSRRSPPRAEWLLTATSAPNKKSLLSVMLG